MKDFLLEAFPNPERKGCPDENTLKALAEDRLPANDPVRLHLGSCSECYAEYRHYRQDWEESKHGESLSQIEEPVTKTLPISSRHRFRLPLSIAAAVLVMCGGVAGYRFQRTRQVAGVQMASSKPVSATVDLFNAPTLRGVEDDPAPLEEVSLPAAVVQLSITLPRFSQSGQYEVAVSKDRVGKQLVAKGAGTAIESDGKVSVRVTLDLRAAKAGAYFLATVRGSDNGTYYYPLKVN
jgi:hypothetical protein